MPSTIVVPSDFSPTSDNAVERAAALAILRGAQLRVVHGVAEGESPARVQAEQDRLGVLVQAVAQCWSRNSPETPSRIDLAFDAFPAASPSEAVARALATYQPELVVMASHGGSVMAPSVAESLVATAPCDVLVVHKGDNGRWPAVAGPILVAVDFSENSRRALDRIRQFDPGNLRAVCVAPEGDAAAKAGHELSAWAGPGVETEVAVGEDVARVLGEVATRIGAVLIVVGTRGMSGYQRLVVGSVAGQVTRTAHVPVLTVH